MTTLQEWRQKRGMTRVALAEKLGSADITVGRWERGRLPELPFLHRIISLTGARVTPNDWFRAEINAARQQPTEALDGNKSEGRRSAGEKEKGRKAKIRRR